MEVSISTAVSPIDCASCGLTFWLDDGFLTRRRNRHDTFYCPWGHSNYFSARSEAERLREQLDRAHAAQAQTREQLAAERKSHAATKGKVTKIKRKLAHGVCPVGTCTRTFANLAQHLKNQHPDFKI